ncbi:hypothetical protein BJ508DRAFT_75196 [Ascobolus immersus RN42]|uniref:Uncharacterized protein n=1 Tax=Ascobolus immersus RN42 TaxID=1160509 RepID=A0A3N4IGG2_ASCIM|nr:hypothetical protein BJ508DRAFT_75196 [Ascobolus immersus RN42]
MLFIYTDHVSIHPIPNPPKQPPQPIGLDAISIMSTLQPPLSIPTLPIFLRHSIPLPNHTHTRLPQSPSPPPPLQDITSLFLPLLLPLRLDFHPFRLASLFLLGPLATNTSRDTLGLHGLEAKEFGVGNEFVRGGNTEEFSGGGRGEFAGFGEGGEEEVGGW